MKCGFHIVLAMILASLPAVASADIVKWTDNVGVTHYTNLKGEVPSQEVVQVVVDEQVWVPQDPASPAANQDPPPQDPVAPPQPRRDTADEVVRAYIAGLDSGLASNVSTGGSVYISGPLAVAVSPPTYGNYVLPGDDWLLPGYYPFVTTSVIGRHRGPVRGTVGTGFRGRFPSSSRFTSAAGPPPIGAAGPPPIGAAGPPPVGAAGRSSLRVSGSRPLR